jgi:hypothetical protein
MKTFLPVLSVLTTLAVSPVMASTYTDALGDNYGGPEVDISSVVINNDASSITFQINMNPAADIGVNHYGNYEIGLQMNGGVGGQTAINGTYGTGNPAAGNPYGNAVGISTGENFFIGNYLDSPGSYSGGAQLYSYSSVSGWTQVGASSIVEVYTGSPSSTFTFTLASLGLTAGNSFKFDVWTTFGSPQGAYDALENPNLPPGTAPYSGGTYDSATAAGSLFASTIYTVQATPEPGTCALLGLGALGMMKCLRRRSAK